ncbi:MAG: PspC domain-containing protein [Propionibacteriaceae bacterium]|jgi:phage shock protein PspC (stress-responsive transcriptional regulator)|nr:PspC domain-containing protein [Propionibacteriaceae bacterium]
MANGPLVRSSTDKILGGVCGGLAKYLGVDAGVIRLITAIACIFFGSGFFIYIIAWILLPLEGTGKSGLDSIIASVNNRKSDGGNYNQDLR